MEDEVCAFHDVIEGPRPEEICFMDGRLPGERSAQQLKVLYLVL